VGGTLGFVALLVLGYLMLRRLLKTRQQTGHYQDYSQTMTAVGPAGYGYPGQSTEPAGVMAKHAPVELPAAPRAGLYELR
jgi:hypothetical protein